MRLLLLLVVVVVVVVVLVLVLLFSCASVSHLQLFPSCPLFLFPYRFKVTSVG